MTSRQLNFNDPSALLKEIKNQRSKLKIQSLIDQCNSEISSKTAEIDRLHVLKEPFEAEIEQLKVMRDRGSLDRFGYREMLEKVQPQHLEYKRRITTLTDECNLRETQISNYAEYVDEANDFFDALNSLVVTYSQVEISVGTDRSRYLLVPESVRRSVYSIPEKYLDSDIELLATKSDLGMALIGEKVGKVENADYRFRDTEILSTAVTSDEVLSFLTNVYSKTRLAPTYKLQSRESGGGAFQRWRDGARSDSYVVCNRCETLYFFGSRCDC
jgi:hypothetical protein